MHGPDPKTLFPIDDFPQVAYIKNLNTNPNIVIGDYTYCDAPEGPAAFFRNILYHFDFIGDKLIIGKYCAISKDVIFIMNGANHDLHGFSTYPFNIFGSGWDVASSNADNHECRGDTCIGNDVWIGWGATIMPGVTIGHGCIVGARAVVSGNIPPYSVAVGNPARVVKTRFSEDVVRQLLEIAWWDWHVDKVTRNLDAIRGADIEAMLQAK